jgi:uncharacterized repeat protein (TIGR04076 family)
VGSINYEIEIEIFKGNGCDHHQSGEKFRYPEDMGKLCPWLMDSINAMIKVLQFGGKLPWKYKDTDFEKMPDVDGITTEFVRCPDPTSAGVVARITRRTLTSPKNVDWA